MLPALLEQNPKMEFVSENQETEVYLDFYLFGVTPTVAGFGYDDNLESTSILQKDDFDLFDVTPTVAGFGYDDTLESTSILQNDDFDDQVQSPLQTMDFVNQEPPKSPSWYFLPSPVSNEQIFDPVDIDLFVKEIDAIDGLILLHQAFIVFE